jgi:hypothetical protein
MPLPITFWATEVAKVLQAACDSSGSPELMGVLTSVKVNQLYLQVMDGEVPRLLTLTIEEG